MIEFEFEGGMNAIEIRSERKEVLFNYMQEGRTCLGNNAYIVL